MLQKLKTVMDFLPYSFTKKRPSDSVTEIYECKICFLDMLFLIYFCGLYSCGLYSSISINGSHLCKSLLS